MFDERTKADVASKNNIKEIKAPTSGTIFLPKAIIYLTPYLQPKQTIGISLKPGLRQGGSRQIHNNRKEVL
ncbi:MAG: hypothetical protein HFH38_07925 [Lachnospiraceae bacterium]|nr:hypothetical protein [Lachnospiraceae bacterium]